MSGVFLGLNSAYHESAACLVIDGRLVAAVEEERFNRVRHGKQAEIANASRIPFASIDTCLRLGKVEMKDVVQIGYSFMPLSRFEANTAPGVETSDDGWGSLAGEAAFRDALLGLPEQLSRHYAHDVSSRWSWLPHHLCHMAGAYFQSGYPDAALLCLDGIGEGSCTTLGDGEGSALRLFRSIAYPDSVGMLWEKISRFLGFTEYDASKTMSLAAFGDGSVFASKFASLITWNGDGYKLDNAILGLRQAGFTGMERFLGVQPRRSGEPLRQEHFDVAAALQDATTRVVLHLAALVKRETGRSRLCLSGGVALNCQTNYALCSSDLFERVFANGAANDAGTAAGAAFLLATKRGGDLLDVEPRDSSFGTSFSDEECEEALRLAGHPFERVEQVEAATAQLLAQGNIVGWFSGRMEFGPRALGSRSILADPRRADLRHRLDEEIKFRDSFRPYAPSVKEDRAGEWFVIPRSFDAAYFMLLACPAKLDRKAQIPAVVHRDGTCRVQLVSQGISPSYYELLDEFEKLTDIPIVLNTSLNSRGPIVQSPAEAIQLFEETTLDVLVLGRLVLRRKGVSQG